MIKKNYLFTLLTLPALLCFGTPNAWGAQSLPYSYGFESSLETDGWTFVVKKGSNASYTGIKPGAKRTGTNGYQLSSFSNAADQYLISPELDAAKGVVFQFYYKASNSTVETFKVGYSTTDANTTSFTWGDQVSTSGTSWVSSEEYAFPAGTKYVAINYYSTSDRYHLYVDDTEFSEPASCPKPLGLTPSAVTATSATFTWTKGGDETEWQWVCLPAATAVDWNSSAVQTATSATATATGLSAETNYKFYVRANCGSEQSAEVSKAFTTPCVDYAIEDMPFEQNFNSLTAGTGLIPDCWSKIANGNYPYIYSSGGVDNSKSLYFSGGTSATSSIIILPHFEAPTNTLVISLAYKNNSTSSSYGQFKIGYMTNPKDASTFVPLKALTRSNSSNPWAEENKFALTSAPANSYIAIQYAGGSYSGSGYLDNIKVAIPSSCTDPSGVSAVAASATSATVSWTENGSATAWNVQYSTDNFATHTDVNNVTTNPYTLTGLTANTTYKVRVQANCGSEQSDWVVSEAFETPCEPTTGIGWTADFAGASTGSAAGLPSCWVKNSTNSYPYIYQYGARSNSRCLYFSAGSGVKPIAVLPPFNESTNTLFVTLWYNNAYDYGDYCSESHGQLEIGYMTNPADASTFTAQEVLPRVCTYTQAKVALTNAPEGSRAAIRYVGGSTAGYAFVDDIAITAIPSCVTPSGVAGSATDVDEATISWTRNGSETAWKIKYSSDNGETWSDEITADANPFTLTGLSAQTTYIVQVKADCGGGEYSEWSASSLPFSTPCLAKTLPYAFDFESAEGAVNAAFPTSACWSRISSSSYPQVYNSGAKSGSQHLRFYGSGTQYAILPQFAEDVKGMTMLFYYYNYSWGGTLSVGYMTDPTDASTFVELIALPAIYSYGDEPTELNLSAAAFGANYIAFKYVGTESYHYSCIDKIVVEKTLSCQKPTEVVASNMTATTADLAWTENNGATAWKVQYSTDGTNWTDANGGEEITSNPYTLTGLTPNHTAYYARVKSVCGGGDGESNWSAASDPFETDCAVSTIPFSENFSAANPCWTKVSCESSTGVNSGAFRFVYNTNPPQYLISPEIDTDSKAVTVAFDYYIESGTYPETFKVGYSKTTNEVSAFTWGATTTATNVGSANTLTYSENLPTGVKYVAIQYLSNNMYYLYIDNFSVTEYIAPACPAVNATTLAANDVTANSATVAWTAANEETAWNLQYKAEGGEWSNVIAISTTPSYDMAGLAENTVYYVRVQANCGEGLSEWTGDEAFSFPTDCEPKAVSKASPWNYGFEDAADDAFPACWERIEAYANQGYPIVNDDSYNAKTGDKYLYFYTPARNGGPAYTGDAILPVFNTEIKNLKLSFAYKQNSTGTNYGQLAIGYVVGEAFTQVGELLAKVEDYTLIEREMPNDAPDGARIAIRCIGSTKSGYSTYAYVDNIQVSLKPTCYTPTNLQAVATSDGAVVTWEDAVASEWTLQYQQGTLGWTEITGISSTSYTLTGLTVDMPYEVQVKAVCGAGDESEWSASANFTPVCSAPTALAVTARTTNSATFSWTSSESSWVLQYTTDGENWESENVTVNPFTLEGLAAGTTYQAKIQAACGSAFSNVVEFSTWCDSKLSLPVELTSFTAILACWEESPAGAVEIVNSKLCFVGEGEKFIYLPQTDVNLNLLSATFTFSGSLEFGYIDAPNGAFQAFENQPTSGEELNLEGEVAAAKYIAIRYNGSDAWSQASISAISIRKTPTCLKPTDVTATPAVGAASINWTSEATAWKLQYKLASAASWSEEINVATKPYYLTGLAQGTSYKVRVQAACAGEELSDWSDEASFTTNCEAVAALPFIDTFDADLSNCWNITDDDATYYAHNVYGGELNLPGGRAASGHLEYCRRSRQVSPTL